MLFFLLVCLGFVSCCVGEYAGTQCAGTNIPTTYATGNQNAGPGGLSFMVQDVAYQFTCCGVVSDWKVTTQSGGTIFFQIWRQRSETEFEMVSQQEFTVSAGDQTITAQDHEKMSFREGDMIGWYSTTSDIVEYTNTPIQNNRYANSRAGTNIGDMFNWNAEDVFPSGTFAVQAVTSRTHNNRYANSRAGTNIGDMFNWNAEDVFPSGTFAVQAVTSRTSLPYFKNLPWYTLKADTEVTVSGISLLTLTANDPDLADNTSLTISMAEEWTDYFSIDAANLVTTARQLIPGTYLPIFRVEEAHCGAFHTATLTVSVYDSMPSITNLPASTNLHEDTLDQTLLYTVSTSDPMNQAIFCEGTWTIGTPTDTPFIVKQISLVPGASTAGIYLIKWPYLDYDTSAKINELVVECFAAGIYLIEWPYLDYDSSAKTYELVVKCYDTYENTATGTFSVNIIRNQEPVFTNMGNMVEINATTSKIGDTVFIVSATDPDGDQIQYDYTCAPATTADGDCPFAVYDNGEVKLKANVLTWNTNTFTLTVTAKANNDSSTSRDLIVYIAYQNNDPVFTNVNGVSKNVAENQALGTSVHKITTTDADSDTITYIYGITPAEGYSLFECTSAGLVRTHPTYPINFEALTATTFTMTIYAHDTKEMVSDTLTLVVTNVNEAVRFNQPSYGITIAEGTAGSATIPTYIAVTDPDVGDTHTYTMNCGNYDSYFTLNTPALTVTFAQDYDLDPGLLPDLVPCSVIVADSGGFNDTATLFIRISYVNDNSPVFVAGNTYTVNAGTDTPVGFFLVSAVATDADREADTIVNYNINQAALIAAGAEVHIQSGHLYSKTNFSAVAVGTYTITIDATDGTNTVTATVNINVALVTTPTPDTSNREYNFFENIEAKVENADYFTATANINVALVTTPTPDTSNREYNFFDDTRNIMWFLFVCLTILGLLFAVMLMTYFCCRTRKGPILDGVWDKIKQGLTIQRTPKHQLDRHQRKKPIYGRQHTPTYKHLHAHELLRASPAVPATPDIYGDGDAHSTRANSSMSAKYGKVMVSQVNLKDQSGDDVSKWVSESGASGSQPKSTADTADSKRRRRRNTTISPLPVSPSVTLPQPSTPDFTIGNGDYDDDDDDFRSERLSIAASRNSNLDDL